MFNNGAAATELLVGAEQVGSDRSRQVQAGSGGGFRWVQVGPDRFRQIQADSGRFRRVQSGSQQQVPVVPADNLQPHTDLSLHSEAGVQSESTTWPLASGRLVQEGGC